MLRYLLKSCKVPVDFVGLRTVRLISALLSQHCAIPLFGLLSKTFHCPSVLHLCLILLPLYLLSCQCDQPASYVVESTKKSSISQVMLIKNKLFERLHVARDSVKY